MEENRANPKAKVQFGTVKFPGFDRTSSWEAFQVQLETLAKLHGWNKAEKASYLLGGALRGNMQLILLNLPPRSLGSYTAKTEAAMVTAELTLCPWPASGGCQKRYYDTRLQRQHFLHGELVWVYRSQRKRDAVPSWTVPG